MFKMYKNRMRNLEYTYISEPVVPQVLVSSEVNFSFEETITAELLSLFAELVSITRFETSTDILLQFDLISLFAIMTVLFVD
mmetsp:Transcript_11642/g.11677  ORF Transcript_11642/g.11677 Transcript_11642/m.11677 type:complete len:82 (-) Transcript_11642:868-1113(-)